MDNDTDHDDDDDDDDDNDADEVFGYRSDEQNSVGMAKSIYV